MNPLTKGLAIACAVLGLLLAVSLAGNAWLFHDRDKAIEAKATAEQLNRDTAAAAQACSASVDGLATATAARGKRLEQLIAGEAGRILTLQSEANEVLSARPANPADLCGSAAAYLRAEIRKERAGAKQ